MKRAVNSIVVGIAILGVTSVVQASPGTNFERGLNMPPEGGYFQKIARNLQLTDQQKQQVKDIFTKNKPVAEPLINQLKAERKALRALVRADAVDEAAIRAQSAKIAALQADMAVHHAHVAAEVRAILTPEQAAKAKVLAEQQDSAMERPTGRHGKKHRANQ